MRKELEALERLTDDVLDKRHYYKQFISSTPHILEDKNLIEKALKVLEIIKEKIKFEEIKAIPFNNYTEYYVLVNGKEIVFDQEEYDLLKEVVL